MGAAVDETAQLLRSLLLYGVLPVWLLAGLGDWMLHRWQRIEESAGWRESALHVLMVAELAVGVVAVLLLQITAAVLVLLLVVCLAHEITVWRDLSYAASRRRIAVAEQWVHALQIASPWVALALLGVIHHQQAFALVGIGATPADWSLRLKDTPLPLRQVAAVLVAGTLMVGLPFLEELTRGLALRRRHSAQSLPRQRPA